MDNQKFFLIVAIFLSIFLLWDKWEITHTVDTNGNLVRQTKTIEFDTPTPVQTQSQTPTQDQDVPSITHTKARVDLPIAPGYTTTSTHHR